MKRQNKMTMAALALLIPATGWTQTVKDSTTVRGKEQNLGAVTVTAARKKNTEAAAIGIEKSAMVVQNTISAQQIQKSQDKDASEVMRRVPGVSLIDDKFVMVRGLSQRYNNVWMNGSAVPSSEADSRAFSFDIIPSSQLDNLTVVKSPSPEYPADYTGGFILINTKEIPTNNGLQLSVGTSVNDRTHFRNFRSYSGSGTDFLGFDGGLRRLDGGMNKTFTTFAGTENINILGNGLNNNWTVSSKHPLPDMKFNASYSYRKLFGEHWFGLLATLNYINSNRTASNMENSLFGSYDVVNDRPVYLRHSRDNQYSNDARLGAMLNLTFKKLGGGTYEWKNLFNQLGRSRWTERRGYNAQNDQQHNSEYYYSQRTTYNSQWTGKHLIGDNAVDWNLGYSYANRLLPDRRLVELNDRTDNKMGFYDVEREFTRLDEHLASAGGNWKRIFEWGKLNPTLRAGAYGEYRARNYRTRTLFYTWNPSTTTLPSDFVFTDDITTLLQPANYGADKLYLKEEVNHTNDYQGRGTLAAGYASMNLPLGRWNVYGGVRYEFSQMELITNTRQNEVSHISTFYHYSDFFPSLNINYKITPAHQLRLSAGRSVNRPEFRELSPIVYYDFDLASNVQGNTHLKSAYIGNYDVRYEFYPSAGEMISVAVFYKRFRNPIEWTYTVAGGTDLVYSNENAKAANNYGIELDLRKRLDFIGLKGLSLSLNASWIRSRVEFAAGSRQRNRPMQGQSPYLINTGLFYEHPSGWSASLLYNRIGKRIVGVGRSLGTSGSEDTKDIPDSYEMPRNVIDFSLSKKIGRWELTANVRDLLAEPVKFQQIETIDGRTINEVTKRYRPGRNIGLTAKVNF